MLRLEQNGLSHLPRNIFLGGQFGNTRSIFLFANKFQNVTSIPKFVASPFSDGPFVNACQAPANGFVVALANGMYQESPMVIDLANSGAA